MHGPALLLLFFTFDDTAGNGPAAGTFRIARRSSALRRCPGPQSRGFDADTFVKGVGRFTWRIMGVTGLATLLKAAEAQRAATDYTGLRLAVDLSLWVHQADPGRRRSDNDPQPHVRLVFHRVARLAALGIRVVCVCDGAPPSFKRDALHERRQNVRRMHMRAAGVMEADMPARAGPRSRSRGRGGSGSGSGRGSGRGRVYVPRGELARWSRDCRKVLEALGVPVVQVRRVAGCCAHSGNRVLLTCLLGVLWRGVVGRLLVKARPCVLRWNRHASWMASSPRTQMRSCLGHAW